MRYFRKRVLKNSPGKSTIGMKCLFHLWIHTVWYVLCCICSEITQTATIIYLKTFWGEQYHFDGPNDALHTKSKSGWIGLELSCCHTMVSSRVYWWTKLNASFLICVQRMQIFFAYVRFISYYHWMLLFSWRCKRTWKGSGRYLKLENVEVPNSVINDLRFSNMENRRMNKRLACWHVVWI